MSRRQARIRIVQSLYELELGTIGVEESIGQTEEGDFLARVLRGATALRSTLDEELSKNLPERWPLRRLHTVLQVILRAALYEMRELHEVPVRVVINEYIEMARLFCGEEETAFVNGVLHGLAKSLRPEELHA